jgi:serine/threonine protein kinase
VVDGIFALARGSFASGLPMSKIRDMLRRGERESALVVLRQLAGFGPSSSAETAGSPTGASPSQSMESRSEPPSRTVWLEALRRLEAEGAFERYAEGDLLALRIRAVVAECVRDLIAAASTAPLREDAPSRRDERKATEVSRFQSMDDAAGEEAEAVSGGADGVPPRIGNFQVLEPLGRGGFGRVYRAVSDDDLRVPVAIKVMHRSDSAQLQRFAAERVILANLRHPNIARFESSGVLEDGRPWIAMEFVDGLSLMRWCERERPSTRDRLVLFRKVCEAIHEAHKWGILHLDIKPDNIMVTIEGEPKLLDFGIARITRSTDPATRSTSGLGGLTPLYSSPEQLRNEPVSSASDVYNLGLVLFELLTGTRARQMASKALDAFVREVLDHELEPPSKRVLSAASANLRDGGARPAEDRPASSSSSTTSSTTSAATAQGGASRLARRLRGDLDTIVMMALRPEPSRRYDSAMALADDVQRHLDQLPIIGRKDSAGYRLGVFLQRHRVGVVAAGLALTSALSVSFAVWSERDRRAQRELAAIQTRIIEAEEEARKARREIEGAPDLALGWVRIGLARDPEVRALLESRVADERRAFDLLLEMQDALPDREVRFAQILALVAPELKLADLRRRSGQASEALKALDALEARIGGVRGDAMTQRESLGLKARILEARGELLGARTPEGKQVNAEALALRQKLIELRGSDTQSRYDYAKLLVSFCDAAIAANDDAAAMRHAEEMLRLRSDILAEVRRTGDAKVIDRRERDVALAHYWIYRAAIVANDLPRARAAAELSRAMMAERLARADGDDPEPAIDLARATNECLTVALREGSAGEIADLSEQSARHAMSAAVRSVWGETELVQVLEVLERQMQIRLLGGTAESAAAAADFGAEILAKLETAHQANQRSVLRSKPRVVMRIEAIQLLRAQALSIGASVREASMAIAALGLSGNDQGTLLSAAKSRPIWVIGLVFSRAALEEGRIAEARSWAAFAVRAALARTEDPLEGQICTRSIDSLAREAPSVIRESELPQLADLRTSSGMAGTTDAAVAASESSRKDRDQP